MLAHRVAGVDRIDEATAEPPAVGRAHLRGTWVRRLAGTRGPHACDWIGVWGHAGGRYLDLADAGETYRQLDRPAEAAACLHEAEQLQTVHLIEGELADLTWTYRAKLEPDRGRAWEWLTRAKAVQVRYRNRMGEARTLLLEARLAPERGAAGQRERLLELRGQVPALTRCPLLGHILERWTAWTGGAADPAGGGDGFWGV